ncbi:hypothetical protein [Dyadobacter pollutisoli]|jgi:hypothetical protein|uniref:Uncharacterized protein n=1 Tax=Dyadobacter pollutisoli TaxID=2910158 RepID=A0A9E8N5L0_9BACT|nr:hypothetical protein [Dyadobacter pollutisoli]WAC10240.1 hypothetical protein ON006_21065 [Dyadobacter pollutisoli]
MKNSVTSFVCAMALSTSLVFGNHIDDKAKFTAKLPLPAATPALETPAPQHTKTVDNFNKYTPAQKAAIVELKVAK